MSVSQTSLDRLPGPRGPAVLQVVDWMRHQHTFFNRHAARYGPAYRIRFPFPFEDKVVVFATARAAEQVLRLPPAVAHAGEAYRVLRQSTGPSSVIVLDEEEHLRMRKIILSPLHGKRLSQWAEFAERRTLDDIATWPLGEPFALRPIMERITMDVILKIVFGVRDPARSEELRRLLPVLFDIPLLAAPGYFTPLGRIDLGPLSPWGSYRRKRDRIDELIFAEIGERRAEFAAIDESDAEAGARSDLMSMLLEARGEDGQPLTDRELRDQLVTMLVAGHETTATSLAWALERLVRTPAVLATLAERLDEGDRTYLDAVIKESMRIRPVVAQFARVLTEPTVIDGWPLPARTMVIIPSAVIHRDPEIYPEPREFRPERFLDGNDPGGYAWLPFGGGVRRCPGASLALLEMRVILAAILRNLEVAPDRPEPERPTVRGITVVPDRGGRIVVRARRHDEPRSADELAAAA
jgi:cytochrome P450 family 135